VNYTGDRRKASFHIGKTFVFYDRSANVYGTAPAENDNDATLDAIFAKYDFTVPLVDLVSNHLGSSLFGKLQSGYDLGSSSVGGFATRHLLFTQSDIDWEIWIDTGSAHSRVGHHLQTIARATRIYGDLARLEIHCLSTSDLQLYPAARRDSRRPSRRQPCMHPRSSAAKPFTCRSSEAALNLRTRPYFCSRATAAALVHSKVFIRRMD
jgi:hypothetical protein